LGFALTSTNENDSGSGEGFRVTVSVENVDATAVPLLLTVGLVGVKAATADYDSRALTHDWVGAEICDGYVVRSATGSSGSFPTRENLFSKSNFVGFVVHTYVEDVGVDGAGGCNFVEVSWGPTFFRAQKSVRNLG
jgi:hypothetical protein